jgi:7-carboxy-7-deazaguanine synthase
MKVVETFNTLQGEGKYLGVPSYFIRTTGCNLRCSWKNTDGTTTICDTPYTSFNPQKGIDYNAHDIDKMISETNSKHLVITGGEPFMQRDLPTIVKELTQKYHITIETNGTIYQPIKGTFLSISPKTKSSYAQANEDDAKLHMKNNNFIDTIKGLLRDGHDYQLKFVYNQKSDLEEILQIKKAVNALDRKIYLMPQGISDSQFKEKQQEMFNICVQYGFNYTPRMHIDIWGNKKGI